MTKTIAINAGSSSLKWQLYDMPEEKVLAKGMVERIGLSEAVFTVKFGQGDKFELKLDMPSHDAAVERLLAELLRLNIISDYQEITGVGHRIVAGGEIFKESVIITDDVLAKIETLSDLAPLHNPANISGIKAFKKILPDIISVAVFDTAFHTTMPEVAFRYGIPKTYYEQYQARKYGAHGTSHYYVANEAAKILGKSVFDLKIITAHIGNGASITAIRHGKSIDTSMGFTPLAGVMMGTRSGDIDPSLIPYLMAKTGITDSQEMIDVLNQQSGLLGVSGISSDMREIIEARKAGNPDAKLAFDIFADRIRKYIAQYFAVLNGADAVVFTAGIGENSNWVRSEIISQMTWFGMAIDESKNVARAQGIISTDDSKVKVLVVPTDEELVIARDVEKLKNFS